MHLLRLSQCNCLRCCLCSCAGSAWLVSGLAVSWRIIVLSGTETGMLEKFLFFFFDSFETIFSPHLVLFILIYSEITSIDGKATLIMNFGHDV